MNGPFARTLVAVLFSLAGILAVAGGIALGILTLIDPDFKLLPHLERAWILMLAGFVFLSVFYVAARVGESAGAPVAAAQPAPEPGRAEPGKPAPAAPPTAMKGPDAATLLSQMRTYIGIEMWDLALDKANEIVAKFPQSAEADAVSRNINELRWKAEPKPPPASAPPPESRSKDGARKMLQHVRTYMELEMWELARARAHEAARQEPESEEAAEAARLIVEIGRRAAIAEPRTIVEP